MFKCKICGNTDINYCGVLNGKLYCRRCLEFDLTQVDRNYKVNALNARLYLKYPLSDLQKNVSDKIIEAIYSNKNVLVNAVTGAGKTELVYSLFEKKLREGKHVGFATPRKDVVIDLLPRFKETFPNLKIVSVYGGNNETLEGDIILCTTHQLCHYKSYFDVLVLDEIDAFPYVGDFVLNSFFYNSINGNYVLLSATSTEQDKENILNSGGVYLTLNQRFHKKPLIVPKFVSGGITNYIKVIIKLKQFLHENKKCFIFVATISKGILLFKFINFFVKGGNFVSSKTKERDEIIKDFKEGKYKFLVTTSILERGVTVSDLQVIVFDSDSSIYTSSSLIQIAGRVGRKLEATGGEVIFYGYKQTKEIKECIQRIEFTNKEANL